MAAKSDPGVALSKLVKAALVRDADKFCHPFTCVRGHDPLEEGKTATTTPRLIVMPGPRRRESLNRGSTLRELSVWIAVVAKLRPGQGSRTEDKDDLTNVDELSAFVTEVEEYFVPNSDDDAWLVDEVNGFGFEASGSEVDPDYSGAEITRGVFMSLIRIDFEQVAT